MALQIPAISLATHVTEIQKNLFNITFKMTCTDDDANMPGLDEQYSRKYRPGDSVTDAVDVAIAYFQDKIESYQSAVAIETHASMTTAMTAIQNGLVT